jgi:hypothetical protein
MKDEMELQKRLLQNAFDMGNAAAQKQIAGRIRPIYDLRIIAILSIVIIVIMAILLGASSALAAKCDAQMSNAPGDIIDSYTDWWDVGESGFQNYVYINGVQNDEYGIERLPADYPCTRFCGPFRFIAKTWNVRIHVEIISGNASGWRCNQVAYVIGHWEPQPRFDLVAISPEAKAEAQWWSDGFARGQAPLKTLALTAAVLCATGDGEACYWAFVFTSLAKGMELGKAWADLFVRDPFDENYEYVAEPQFHDPVSQLGAPQCNEDGAWLSDFCRWSNYYYMLSYAYWERAWVSANRAASCAQVGREDCFWMQKAAITESLRLAGTYTEYLAYGMAVASWNVPTRLGGDQSAYDLAQGASAQAYEVAFRMENAQ